MPHGLEATKQHLLETFRPPKGRPLWHEGPTPENAVRQVNAELAKWQPKWARHSIWELTLHIAYWRYAVRRLIEPTGRFPRSPSNWPRISGPDEESWRADVALLKSEGDAFHRALMALEPGRLAEVVPGRKHYTLLEKIQGVIIHDNYHTAQIQILKKSRAQP